MYRQECYGQLFFELLNKENDLSFNLSLLDCILLNEDSNLDSVEATISFLIDEIQNRESEHTKVSKRESKQKGNLRFAVPLSTKQIEYLSTKLVPPKNIRFYLMGNLHLVRLVQ